MIADESTSMLDVSIRISMLAMLGKLRDDLGVGFLFITHDLAIAKYFGWHGKTAVMYLGRIVEFGPTPQIINAPEHPYTKALIEAIPEPDPDLTKTKGAGSLRSMDIPSLTALPSGCTFHPRCGAFEAGLCDTASPELKTIKPEHTAACLVAQRDHGVAGSARGGLGMIPAAQRMAAGWSIVLVVASVLLLIGMHRGTPEFVITVLTLCIGLLLGAGAALVGLLARRSQRRHHRSPSATTGTQ